jgi:hypothetical protein
MSDAVTVSPLAKQPDHVADTVVYDFAMFHDPALVSTYRAGHGRAGVQRPSGLPGHSGRVWGTAANRA